MRNILILLIAFAVSTWSCKDDSANTTAPQETLEKVIKLTTEHGEMHIWLFKGTPLHRENFLKLTEEGFYNDTEFHRLVDNFVIQGGDPNSKNADRGDDGQGGPGYTIPAEIDISKYKHVYGSLAAARLGDRTNPERASSGSQFYIAMDQSKTAQLDGAYTVYGQVIDGMATAEAIAQEPHNTTTGLPNKRIPMQVSVVEMSKSTIKSRFNYDIPE